MWAPNAAPMATKPICPSDCPPTVSTVIDRMTRANMITAAALRVAPGPSTAGSPTRAAAATAAGRPSGPAYLGPVRQLGGHRPDLPRHLPGRGGVGGGPGDVPAPGQQRHEDDDRQHRRHDEVAAQVEVERADRQLVVPADVGLEQPERHGAGHDGRHVRQAAEHEGGQGAQQDREPDR